MIGAGPAGMATAMSIHQAGHDVMLLERYTQARPAGNILNLWPPPIKALRLMGVDTVDLGAPCYSEFRTAAGRTRVKVILPEGSLLNPKFPAALSNRLNVHTRFFDCQSGALGQKAPELSMAAGYGTSPYFVYHGEDENGDYFQMVELLFGGLPGRPIGDGLDGHSWWPLFRTTPAEYMESYYPVVVERYEPVMDTGGAGLHRGGCGIEKQYMFRRPGAFTINDDRAVLDPWGIGGGDSGGRSAKLLLREPALVERDVRRRLVSKEAALELYGVAVGDAAATAARRAEILAARGGEPLPRFDFGEMPEGLVPPR